MAAGVSPWEMCSSKRRIREPSQIGERRLARKMVDEIAAGHGSNGRTDPRALPPPSPATLHHRVSGPPAQSSPALLGLLPIANCPLRLSPHFPPHHGNETLCCPFVSPFDYIVERLNGTHAHTHTHTLLYYQPWDSAILDSQNPVSSYVCIYSPVDQRAARDGKHTRARKVLARPSTSMHGSRTCHVPTQTHILYILSKQLVSGVWSLVSDLW